MNDDPLESVPDRPWCDGDPLPSQCLLCEHRDPGETGIVCDAFTWVIPMAIQLNRFDHCKPWTDTDTGEPGDTGFRSERSIAFQPRAGVYPHLLRALYRHLDSLDGDEGRMFEVLFRHFLEGFG